MPYKVYCTDVELAAYGAMFNSRSPVGNSTIFVNLLQRVSEKRFKSEKRDQTITIKIPLNFNFTMNSDDFRYLRITKYLGKR